MPGGPVLHCASVKVRVVGQGTMRATMYGFDELESDPLYPQVLNSVQRMERVLLANMQGERMKLRIYTTALDDFVKINNITFFVRPLWASNPLPDDRG